MKKILSFVFLFAMILTIQVGADSEDPTYSFDTAIKKSDFSLVDSSNLANIKFDISSDKSMSGGAMKVSANVTGTLEADYQGIALTADKFGLENFAGCKIKMFTMFPNGVSSKMNFAQFFTNGTEKVTDAVWGQVNIQVVDGESWGPVSITVPADCTNDLVGIKLPITTEFSGVLCYIDNIYVYDAEGNLMPNEDGYVKPKDDSSKSSDETLTSVPSVVKPVEQDKSDDDNSSISPVVFIVIGLVILAGGIFAGIVIREKKRFY